ncbi:MAG: hypothetical protein R3F07_11440 [Opitutaceae bacterium]
MVAAAHRIEAEQPDVAGENRVWDFLGASPNRLGQAATQVADCDWEMTVRLYDSRRGPSLAQRGDSEISTVRVQHTVKTVDELVADIEFVLKAMDEATDGKYGFYSEEAVELLLGTALQESGGLRWRSS